MNNSPQLTSGQKAAITRKANEQARKQAQAKKDAWATRRARYGSNGFKSKGKDITEEIPTKFFAMQIGKFTLEIAEGSMHRVVINGYKVRLID